MSEHDDDHFPVSREEHAQLMEAVHQLVEERHAEAQDRREERDLKRYELETNKEIALRSIDAQERDRQNTMTRFNSHLIHRYIFVGLIILAILTFSGFALWLGFDGMIGDLLKIIAGLVAGGLGGYGWGRSESRKDRSGDDS